MAHQKLFNFLADNGFVAMEDDMRTIINIVMDERSDSVEFAEWILDQKHISKGWDFGYNFWWINETNLPLTTAELYNLFREQK